jgi:hypothetical protein
MNEIGLAYTAGIIDGEGSINISRIRQDNLSRGVRHRLIVAVGRN